MRQEIVGFWDGSRISLTICKQSAPHSRQITTPVRRVSFNIYEQTLHYLCCRVACGFPVIFWSVPGSSQQSWHKKLRSVVRCPVITLYVDFSSLVNLFTLFKPVSISACHILFVLCCSYLFTWLLFYAGAVYTLALYLCVCLSQFSVLSKWLNRLTSFWHSSFCNLSITVVRQFHYLQN